jgi:hypothetical protein
VAPSPLDDEHVKELGQGERQREVEGRVDREVRTEPRGEGVDELADLALACGQDVAQGFGHLRVRRRRFLVDHDDVGADLHLAPVEFGKHPQLPGGVWLL